MTNLSLAALSTIPADVALLLGVNDAVPVVVAEPFAQRVIEAASQRHARPGKGSARISPPTSLPSRP